MQLFETVREFGNGERVFYVDSGGARHPGRVRRVNRLTVSVDLDDGRQVRIKPRDLERRDPSNVIRLPQHFCGCGKRVWFERYDGIAVSGTIVSINAYSAKIRPDDPTVDHCRVTHAYIKPLSTKPKATRTEAVILHELARCYVRLDAAWERVHGRDRRPVLHRRIRKLQKELGREVSRDEALDWALHRPPG